MSPGTSEKPTGNHFPSLTAAQGAALIRTGELRPSDWMKGCLDRSQRVEKILRAWAYLDPDQALDSASKLNQVNWQDWQPTPHLAGVPIAVKDVFNTSDMPTQMGSQLWSGFRAGNDSRSVAHAKYAGSVVMGKSATAEFAVHSASDTINPHDPRRICGTSSAGSAVVVASGMAPIALGTQTGGSIIRPASYNGVIGFKPSFGLVARTGVLKTCDTLDTIGWFARSVADIRVVLDALVQRGRDYPITERGFAAAIEKRLPETSFRIAFAIPPRWHAAEEYAREAVRQFANQLANRREVEVGEIDFSESFSDAHDTHSVIYNKSLAYYFEKELRTPEMVSGLFRESVEHGRSVGLSDYLAATKRQREMEHQFAAAMANYDVLVTLSVAGEAPDLETERVPDDSALVWTMCGASALSLPVFIGPNGLPYGLQIVAPRFNDYTLLDFAELVFPEILEPVEPN